MDWLKPIEQRLAIMASLPPDAENLAGPVDILAQDCRKLIAAVRLGRGAATDLALGYPIHLVKEKLARLRSGELEEK